MSFHKFKDGNILWRNALLDANLVWWWWHDFQYSFRSSQSTADLLTFVCDRNARVLNRFRSTQAVVVDISKAFDQVWYASLFHNLKYYGILGQIFGHILYFPTKRQLWVVLDGKYSQEYPANAGVFQGSILGPTFSLLYIHDLHEIVCNIAVYADDITLYSKCNQVPDLWLRNLNLICKTLWPEAGSGLLISVLEKLNLFCLNGLITLVLLTWKWTGLFFEKNYLVKMLELLFSSKLDWGSYTVYIAKIPSKTIGLLIHSMKFISPEVALFFYKSSIQPYMEYCCHVCSQLLLGNGR